MPGTITALRRVPWMRVWLVATWLYRNGRHRLETNLAPQDRRDLWELMRKSGGRPQNLSRRERDRFRDLVRQAATGRPA
jgi:hypothetical protein